MCAQGRGRAGERTTSRLGTERGGTRGRSRDAENTTRAETQSRTPQRLCAQAPPAPALPSSRSRSTVSPGPALLLDTACGQVLGFRSCRGTRQNRKAAREASSSPQAPLPAAGSCTVRCGHRGRRPSNPNREPGLTPPAETRRLTSAGAVVTHGVAGVAAMGLVETRGRTGIRGHTGLGGVWPARERRTSVPG